VIKGGETHAVPPRRSPRWSARPAPATSRLAGFLYGFTRGKPLAECARLGGIAAAEIISHVGARRDAARTI
jgi:hypothetical protein